MKDKTKARLAPDEMRKVLLANASVLMCGHFMANSPEVSGPLKEIARQEETGYLAKERHR